MSVSITNKNVVKRNEFNASNNMTMMVLFVSFLYVFMMTPFNVANILNLKLDILKYYVYVIFIAHGINIVVYFWFNKLFRQSICNIFSRCKYK